MPPLPAFTYDNGGRRITRTLGDTPGTVTTWSYAGRLDNLVTSITTPNVISFAYTYDANQNKLTETIGGVMSNYGFGTTTPAGYDTENRLTALEPGQRQSRSDRGISPWPATGTVSTRPVGPRPSARLEPTTRPAQPPTS